MKKCDQTEKQNILKLTVRIRGEVISKLHKYLLSRRKSDAENEIFELGVVGNGGMCVFEIFVVKLTKRY